MSKEIIEQLNTAFQGFQEANSERMRSIEARIDEIQAGNNRAFLSGVSSTPATAQDREHMRAFLAGMRTGRDHELNSIQAAMQVGSGPDGGFTVPTELDKQITALVVNASPMRRLATVLPVSTSDYKRLVSLRGSASGWVGETDDRPETNTPKLEQLTPYWGEIYANPTTTQILLDDAAFDIEGWLTGEIATEFAYQEGSAFITGNGVKKPRGILNYPTAATADGSRPFGTLQYVVSGNASGFATTAPADCLIDLIHSVKAEHRRNASFLCNQKTLGTIRKLKDGQGNYLWAESMRAGDPPTFAGYPVETDESMPDVAANAFPIAFGDFKRFIISDRVNWNMIRDPYSKKGFVSFYSRKRVGSMLLDTEAIKLLKISA